MAFGATFPLSFVIGAIDKTAAGFLKGNARLEKISATARRVGRSMSMALTLPVLAGGVAVFKYAAEFEKGMNRVRALSGAQGESFENLRSTALELGKTSVFTASQVAGAMGFYAQAGFNAKKIIAAVPATLNLAAAAGEQIELAQAADITAGVLAGYSYEAERAGHVSDILTNAFTKAKTDLPALGEAMQDIGPIASSMKIPLSETVSLIQALSEKQIGGSEAGTKLRNIILAIQKPVAEGRAALASLGIEASALVDPSGRVKSITAIIQELERAKAQPKHLSAIFNKRDVAAVMALMAKGSPEIRKFQLGLLESGRAAHIADIQMEGAAGGLARFHAGIEAASVAIGDSGFLDWVTAGIEKVAAWSRKVASTNPELLKMGAKVALVVAVGGPLLIMLGAVAAALAVLATPVGAVVAGLAAIGGVTVYVIRNWDELKVQSKLFWRMLPDDTKRGVKFMLKHWIPVWGIYDRWKTLWEGAKTVFGKAWDWIVSKFDKSWLTITGRISKLSGLLPQWVRDEIGLGSLDVKGGLGPAAATGSGGIGRKRESRTILDFRNVPKGVRIERVGDQAGTDLEIGHALGNF